MARFVGTAKDFKKIIGPYIRNWVQNKTRPYKNKIGRCENDNCQSTEHLEAAHILEKGRGTLIDVILEEFTKDRVVDVDINDFVDKFKELHSPLHQTIKVLCHSCHVDYDKGNLSL